MKKFINVLTESNHQAYSQSVQWCFNQVWLLVLATLKGVPEKMFLVKREAFSLRNIFLGHPVYGKIILNKIDVGPCRVSHF